MIDTTSVLQGDTALLVASCRELALLAFKKYLRTPWDDKAMILVYEMHVRVARSFNNLENIGQARLYISKATELKEEIEDKCILSPSTNTQFQEALCVYYGERIRMVPNSALLISVTMNVVRS